MLNKPAVAVISIVALLLLVGQFVPALLAEREMPFATISKDVYGGGAEAKNVIRPEGDAMFIELHLGEKPTGGYDIEAKHVKEFPDRVIVNVERTYPGKNCLVTEALTQPFHVIKIPKTSKPILYEYADRTVAC